MTSATSIPTKAENIAVCIRIRPMNEREKRSNDVHALCSIPSIKTVSLLDPITHAPLSGKGHVFQYDEIFDTTSDTNTMYERVGRRIIHSTLNGINGTIFAYGQTSSGKTYTMQGDTTEMTVLGDSTARHVPKQAGFLQLAVDDMFVFIENCMDRDFLLRVSYLEIYNEVIKDLLHPMTTTLKLREDPKKGIYVDCNEEIITSYEDIVMLLQRGNRNRTVGHTAMNEKSSRSHSVFRIVIESKQKADSRRLSEEDVNGAVLVASLNLVDLAGSESLRHTGAEGIRQREAGNINKSLLTLARVINSLSSSGGGGQNAPFRDSKLTRLLQNSLGGNTRTLMICCVTPSDKYIEETKSTLQFAARAKDIQTSATVNEVLDDQTQLRRLKREVHELKKLVNSEALDALKAENEALISEKNHNKTEMARLMGLILSSTSVTKANNSEGRKRKRRKWMRETWGPGDFPVNIKTSEMLSPNYYPRKRHSPIKENMDPQTLFRVYEDVDDNLAKAESPAIDAATSKVNLKRPDVDDSIENVIDMFSAVFRSYHDENCKDPIFAVEATVSEKRALLEDSGNVRAAFNVLAEIQNLMVVNLQSRVVMDEKKALEQTVRDLRTKLDDGCGERDDSKSVTKAGISAEELMAELVSTRESVAEKDRHCHDLEIALANTQQMAAEELYSLRCQLEALKLESTEVQQQHESEPPQLVATVEKLQSDLSLPNTINEDSTSLYSRKDAVKNLVGKLDTLQPTLQLTLAERDEDITSLKPAGNEAEQTELVHQVTSSEAKEGELQTKISKLKEEAVLENEDALCESKKESPENVSCADETENVVEKLAEELQNIMQELAQLQSDHEQTALEKEELQVERERMSQEIESSKRQLYAMSETLMEKEHIAKVLQAQLDAKLVTISQMQTKHSNECETLQHSIRDLATQKEQLLTKLQEVGTAENTATDEVESDKMAIDCIENVDDNILGAKKTQQQCSVVERTTEQHGAVESELADRKTTTCSTVQLPERIELKNAFDQSKVDLQTNNSTAIVVKQEQIPKVSLCDKSSIAVVPDCFEHQYNALKDDLKRVTEELEHVSHERNDCIEELRALEAQLMQVSEEKMKFAIAASEQEMKLREVQKTILSSSLTITKLQAQLEDTHSEKAILEANKTECEQNIENLQITLTTLQADYAALVEQKQHEKAELKPGSGRCNTSPKHLQQHLEMESKERKKLELDVQSYEETLSVLRKEAKGNSDMIADLLEKIKVLERDLASAACTQQTKDKECAILKNALARSEEEQQEMRHQSKQRLVSAEGKEMELQDQISALKLQLKKSSSDMAMVSIPQQNDVELNLLEAKAKQAELQSKATVLEKQLLEAKQELFERNGEWNKQEALANTEIARLAAEQTKLRDELSTLKTDVKASQHAMKAQAEELLKANNSCAELLEQKELVQRQLEASDAAWNEKQHDMLRQMDNIREQLEEAQIELERHQKTADDEIQRLHSVVEQRDAEIDKLERCTNEREENWKVQICKHEEWQKQVNSRQEALQAEYDELKRERRLLEENHAAVEAQHKEIEAQLRNEMCELQQKTAAAQAQQAIYQAKLKEIEGQLEMTENEVTQTHRELKQLAGSLKSAQMEAADYQNKLMEVELAQESMEKLVDIQKARIDKLDKVKMTTETLELFRKLKKDRLDLQTKVQTLQKDLAQCREDQLEKEYGLVKRKEEELKLLKEQITDLCEALRTEKRQALDAKAKMLSALNDEREKAEHEVQKIHAIVKEKKELVEKLETQLASAHDAMTKLREQKREKVSYLENESLKLHVENKKLKQQLKMVQTSDDEMDIDDTMVSTTAAAKMLDKDSGNKESEEEEDGYVRLYRYD